MVKTVEALIAVKFIHRGDKVFQHFVIEKKRGVSKYLLDTRFLVYDKFEEKIKELALSKISEDYFFLDRRQDEDRIILEFRTDSKKRLLNYYFVIPGFVPTTSGCESCKFRVDNEDGISFYCDFKEKTLTHKLKNCQFFRQEEKLFKT
jgi:predicted dithiol-disulfide oxidoreductase (DUF899 family)